MPDDLPIWAAGEGPPPAGLLPLDGINNPYRWAPDFDGVGAWVSPAYSVTWANGNTIPYPNATARAGANNVRIIAGTFTTLDEASVKFHTKMDDPATTGIAVRAGNPQLDPNPTSTDNEATFVGAGSGVAFLVQYKAGFGQPAATPVNLNITTLLGPLTVGAAYTWPASTVGVEGNLWLDTTGPVYNMYGPKTAGAWGPAQRVTGAVLTGPRAPYDDPPVADGVNDPWAWNEAMNAWVGPVYSVTWTSGAVIPSFGPITGYEQLVLRIGPWTGFGEGYWVDATPALWGVGGMSAGTTTASSVGTATDSMSGVAYLLQRETGFTGPTVVPNPTRNVTTMLGTGVTVGAAYTWPAGDGLDGDFWLDTLANQLYGPKTGGLWGETVLTGFDPFYAYTIVGPWRFTDTVRFDNTPVRFNNNIFMLGGVGSTYEPDDGDLDNSQLAIWYDATTGAPVVNFKGKDAAGAVSTARLPLMLVQRSPAAIPSGQAVGQSLLVKSLTPAGVATGERVGRSVLA